MKFARTYRHGYLPTSALLILILVTFACSDKVEQLALKTASQGVTGVVTLTPGYDGEDAGNQINPPDRTPRPLPNATVYLIWKDSVTGARTFLDSTLTDSTGHYVLPGPPGQYYVAAGSMTVIAPVLVSLPGDTTRLQRKIQALVGLNIVEGHFIDQPLDITALLTE